MKLNLEVIAKGIVEVEVPSSVSEGEIEQLLDSLPLDLDGLPNWAYIDYEDFTSTADVEVVDGEVED